MSKSGIHARETSSLGEARTLLQGGNSGATKQRSRCFLSLLLLAASIFASCDSATAQTYNFECEGSVVSTDWTRHFVDPSNNCWNDGAGGRAGADGVDVGDFDAATLSADGYFDIVTGWEESGEVIVATNPGPATIRSVGQWPTTNVSDDAKQGLEDAIFVDSDGNGVIDSVASAAENHVRDVFVHHFDFGAFEWKARALDGDSRYFMRVRYGDILKNGGCNDLVAGSKDNAESSGGNYILHGAIHLYACPGNWQPGDPINSFDRYKITDDIEFIMELELVDMDFDGDLDVLYTDRRKVGWMANPKIGGGGDPTVTSQWIDNVIEYSGDMTGGKGEAYRWSHFVDIIDNGLDPNLQPLKELVVATNYDFNRGVVARWFERRPNLANPAENLWDAHEIVVQGGLPFYKDKEGSQTSKAVRAHDLDDDGRIDLVMTARGGEHDNSQLNPGKGVGVYRLSLPIDVDDPPRCGNSPLDPSCGSQAKYQWVVSPIGRSFRTMKYDNIAIVDFDADGDPDIATVEENVDGAGLGTVWYENEIWPVARDDVAIVPADAGVIEIPVADNDKGLFLDPPPPAVAGCPAITILPPLPPAPVQVLPSATCGAIDFHPDPLAGETFVSFRYQICRSSEPTLCAQADVDVAVTAAAALLANGSFESPVVPPLPSPVYDSSFAGLFWTITGEVTHAAGWLPVEGNQSLLLKGPSAFGGVEQTLNIVQPGKLHVLQFAQAGSPGAGPSTLKAEVKNGAGATLALGYFPFDSTSTTALFMGWKPRNLWFAAPASGTTELSLSSWNGAGMTGAAVDDVRVAAVPNVYYLSLTSANTVLSNQVLSIDLADRITLLQGSVDFTTSRVTVEPDPQCGTLIRSSTGQFYDFVPAAGVETLIPGVCSNVNFRIEFPVSPDLPAEAAFPTTITSVGSLPPVAIDDQFSVPFEQINGTQEWFTFAPLANDTDSNCTGGMCYGQPSNFTTPSLFAECKVVTGDVAPKRMKCRRFNGIEPPVGSTGTVVSFDYDICDEFGDMTCDTGRVNITITPRPPVPAQIFTSPDSLDFGDVQVDQAVTVTTTVTNSSSAETDLVVSGLDTTGAGAFSVAYPFGGFGGLPFTLAPGQSQIVVVRALSGSVGVKTGTLTIFSNDPDADEHVPLQANFVPPPEIGVGAGALSFGNVGVGQTKQLSLGISNVAAPSSSNLEITSITLTGNTAGSFSIASPPPMPLVLGGGSGTFISVEAAPGTAAPSSATLKIKSNDPVTPTVLVPLDVTGVAGQITHTPDFVQYGYIGLAIGVQKTVILENVGSVDAVIDSVLVFPETGVGSFNFAAPIPTPFTLTPGQTKTIGINASSSTSNDFTALLRVDGSGLAGVLEIPLEATTLPVTRATHFGDAHPSSERWVVTPGDTGEDTNAIFADGQFPGVSAFGVHDDDEALRYQVPGPLPTDAWILRSRLRLVDLNKAATNAVHLDVTDANTTFRVEVGTANDGGTELDFVGDVTVVVPPVQSGRSDYVLVEIVRTMPSGLADVFVNGEELLSDWAGIANAYTPRVAWGDGRSALQSVQVSRGRYEFVEFLANGVPACSDGIDNDSDGVIDGDDPDCSQPNDPSENEADHDHDGLSDGFEFTHGLVATDADQNLNGVIDGQDDFDADGLANESEQRAGTDPFDDDSDDDGLLDGEELAHQGFGAQQIISNLANGAQSVTTGDVDGDGDLDVFSASKNDGEIALYRNDGSGVFGFQEIIASDATDTRSVAVGDIDGDGKLDAIAAAQGDDSISWYRQNTVGWDAASVIGTDVLGAESVAVADVDGDGDLDVVATSLLDDTVAWYENIDGLGAFTAAKVITTGADEAYWATLADLDGDRDLDLLTASALDDTVDWFRNEDGAGSFSARTDLSNTADGARVVLAADLDGDGDLDAVSGSSGDSKIAWYANDGSGGFGSEQLVSTQSQDVRSLHAADFDGDGDIDLLVGSSADDQIAWYENTGGGGFAAKFVISSAQNGPRSVFAADLDDDGDLDVLAVSNADDEVAWYENLNLADPGNPDTDGDGLLDGFEVVYGLDPLVAGEQGLDPDFDDLDNLGEQAAGTDPFDEDSDDDGFMDGFEVARGSNPLDDQSVPVLHLPAMGPIGTGLLVLALLAVPMWRRRAGA